MKSALVRRRVAERAGYAQVTRATANGSTERRSRTRITAPWFNQVCSQQNPHARAVAHGTTNH